MNYGKVYTKVKKLQKSYWYNMKVFSVNQILRKGSKSFQYLDENKPPLTDFPDG